jgi:3-oxoacyl-[acyl-carrier protein] reductase
MYESALCPHEQRLRAQLRTGCAGAMVRAMGDDYISKHTLPFTQLSRLIRPEKIADAICFMLANSAVSGELWADAGWHAPA